MNDFVETVQENPPMEQPNELANNLNNDSLNGIKQTMDLGAKEESWLERLFDRISNWVEDVFDISGDGSDAKQVVPKGVTTVTPGTVKEYYGPSPQVLEYKIDRAREDLEKAEARLQEAARNGQSTVSIMQQVNNCRKILDTLTTQYQTATAALSGAADTQAFAKASSENDEVKFASVSHKQWELEQAIESGNKVAIENKKRALAHEIAKEEAKKLQRK